MSLDANNEDLDDESSMADFRNRKMQEFLTKCGLPKEYKVADIDSESLPVLYKLSMDSSDPAVVDLGRQATSEGNSVSPEQSTSGIMSTSDGDQSDKSVLESSNVPCDEKKPVPNSDDWGLKQKALSSPMAATDRNALQTPMKEGIKSLHKHVDVISQEADIATQEIYQHLVKHSPSPQKTSQVSRSLMVDEMEEGTGTDTGANGGTLDKKAGETTRSVELERLEPWQKLLFERLDHQKEAIEDCRNRIDAVGHIVANIAHNQNFGPWAPNHHDHPHQEETDGTQLWSSPPHQHQRQAHPDLFNQSHDGTTNNDPSEEATETDNDADGFLIPFEVLENFIDGLWFFPRKVNAFLTNSRPFRLVRLIYSEAENYRIPGAIGNARFLNAHLIMKLVFLHVFFSARIANRSRVELEGEESFFAQLYYLWMNNLHVVALFFTILIYILQSGLAGFLFQIIVKDNLIKRVWNDEDLAPSGRRGQRDRRDLVVGENMNQENEPGGQNRQGGPRNIRAPRDLQEAVVGNLANQFEDTFVFGVIDHRLQHDENIGANDTDEGRINEQDQNHQPLRLFVPAEHILLARIVEIFKDIFYLIGSFFLSLFPMWHPRPGALNQQNAQRRDAIVRDHDDENVNVVGGANDNPNHNEG